MDDPPDDVVAAWTRLDKSREKTVELSRLFNDDHTQNECAAGALCVAPPGTDLSASAHRCLECRGKIHCAMWCGENWGEYIASDHCKITPEQLSAAGRASVQNSDHELITICRVCVDRLESPSPFSSESNGLLTEAPSAIAATSTNDPIVACAWDDVIVSTLATNMAQKQKKNEPLKPSNSTRLQGFRINGVLLPTFKVSRDLLMKWSIGKGRSKARKFNKQELCEAIVGWKADHDIAIANGTAETADPVTQRPFRFNTKRFLNVTFGPTMKPKISMRGQALTAGELEDKKKTDQDLFTAFIVEYYKILPLYSCHAFTYIDNFMNASVLMCAHLMRGRKHGRSSGSLWSTTRPYSISGEGWEIMVISKR
jgi:hypothetical protein